MICLEYVKTCLIICSQSNMFYLSKIKKAALLLAAFLEIKK